ncbi:hypothetical protein [Acinetobacter indicus]|uniref:hypothetical protein n=1 Tax=Acinetobacter indicus TaxID=756892 RepID=UPI0034CECD13
MNILNSKEAFDAMMAGRNIMCRAVGELMDFDDLSQFPATIFAMPGYEFCIKVETMELAGITFAKPLKLEEVREGQDVYVINTYGSSIYVVEFGKMTCTALIESINNGFAQHDAKNAKLQLQAISKALGREKTGDCLVVRLGDEEKPKKKRSTKAKNDADQLNTPADSNTTVANIEKQPELEVVQPIEVAVQDPSVTTEVTVAEANELDETDPAILKVIEAINKCNSDYELQGVERNLDSNKYKLVEVEYEQLKQRINEKREDLNAVGKPAVTETIAPETPADSSAQYNVCSDELSIEELKKLQEEAENIVAGKQPEPESDGGEPSQPTDMLYTKKKETLINRIYEMDSVEALERLAPAIPAAKLTPEDHQAVLQIYAQHKQAMEQVA